MTTAYAYTMNQRFADACSAPAGQSACLNTVLDAACVAVSIFIIRLLVIVRIFSPQQNRF